NYTLAQTTADTTTLKNHLNDHIASYGQSPETLTADAGYGSAYYSAKKELPIVSEGAGM
ncbi:hypothetical protein SAMN05660413_03207, partial [Salegentibacter flavus]